MVVIHYQFSIFCLSISLSRLFFSYYEHFKATHLRFSFLYSSVITSFDYTAVRIFYCFFFWFSCFSNNRTGMVYTTRTSWCIGIKIIRSIAWIKATTKNIVNIGNHIKQWPKSNLFSWICVIWLHSSQLIKCNEIKWITLCVRVLRYCADICCFYPHFITHYVWYFVVLAHAKSMIILSFSLDFGQL